MKKISMKKIVMKKLIIMFVAALLAQQIAQAQGTVYMSNLSQSSTGSVAAGNNQWIATGFETGPNAGGYLLDSIQLAMTNATGSPSGFDVMLYSANILDANYMPVNNLVTLTGSADPSTAGIYTYTPASNFMLSPMTPYYIVVTAGTTITDGAYEWSVANYNYNKSGNWLAPLGIYGPIDNYISTDGSTWNFRGGSYQYTITAEPVPEPSVLGLLALDVLLFFRHRRKAKFSLWKPSISSE